MTGLPDVTWLSVPRTRATNGGQHHDWIAHAIRNGHGLCGLNAARFTWETRDDAKRCPVCAATPQDHASAIDITALGVTYRNLDYWCRMGWLHPINPDPGSGTRRLFPPGEYRVAVLMVRYVAAGVSPAAAARAARRGGALAGGVRLVLDEQPPAQQHRDLVVAR